MNLQCGKTFKIMWFFLIKVCFNDYHRFVSYDVNNFQLNILVSLSHKFFEIKFQEPFGLQNPKRFLEKILGKLVLKRKTEKDYYIRQELLFLKQELLN